MEKTLLILLGPTAVGKTKTALAIAELFSSPIINADSRQLYRDLPIGTAAPTVEEQALVKHYFVGDLSLTDYYSAAQYETDVLSLLSRLFAKRDIVVLSGGSMLYIDAVCNGIDYIPTIDASTRYLLNERLKAEGPEALKAELKLLDPAYYQQVDLKNTARIVHALEVCYMTGQPFSSFRTKSRKSRPFRVVKFGLWRDRAELFERISQRTEEMMIQGLLEEAKRVLPFRHNNALNTVGYKELFKYFDGEWDLPFAVEKIKRNTRVYSKKQMTWFKKDPEVHWFKANDNPAYHIMQSFAKNTV
ncbi:tRNA (adenosine(37)-N6)-dimethylallyltransferase MiaA [Alloprevotella tannerae]|uniref:tRNA dimethylallyltransferase n=1 Tax=Alloprevotella tannerae TaxID=76122 RepID=A0A929S0H2_9BACT|nr:tRNA (adenosine(37)-N6)-dimethylallyltransferase MiaA [Alloprevotella tannerae]MBF0971029.1 tRNA (adenosine(37)-N6)-dimethylallyltransferase MiaA [Alloprevotella tannerae]